ncbi:hypothetical protein RLIN73S_02067 [Rhodanobacter lindaniclasticus]
MQAWEAMKAAERKDKGEAVDHSALAGVSTGLPEWKRAQKLQQRAAATHFDQPPRPEYWRNWPRRWRRCAWSSPTVPIRRVLKTRSVTCCS